MRFIPAVSRVRIPLSLSKKSLVNVDFTGLSFFVFASQTVLACFRLFQTDTFGVKIGVKIGVKTIKKLGSKISVIYTFGVKIGVRKFELFFSRKFPFFITFNSQMTTFYEF